MGKVVVVTSGKGGVGKTTSSAALGAALAQRGEKVVVVDFDVGLRNLDLVMGAERRVVYDLVNVIQGDAKLQQALIRDKRVDTLFLLPASQTRDKDNLTPEGVEQVINDLRRYFDWVICDSPAGIERGEMRRSIDTNGQAAHDGYARGGEVARDLACHNRAPRGWCACPDYSEGVLQGQRTFHVEKERSVCGHPQQSWVAWPAMGEQLNARFGGLLAIGLSCSHCCFPRSGLSQRAGNTRVDRGQLSNIHRLNTVLGCSFAQRCSTDAWKPAEGD